MGLDRLPRKRYHSPRSAVFTGQMLTGFTGLTFRNELSDRSEPRVVILDPPYSMFCFYILFDR